MSEKMEKIVKCLDKWLELREREISLAEYCKSRKARQVGIYGYGKLGRHLVWELETQGIQISWIMDQRYEALNRRNIRYRFLPPDEISVLEDVDMVIVTALEDYYKIEANFCKDSEVNVVSIEEMINVMFE